MKRMASAVELPEQEACHSHAMYRNAIKEQATAN